MTMTLKDALSIYSAHRGGGGAKPHLIGLNAHNLVTDHQWSVNSSLSVMVTLKKILHSTLFDGPLKSEVSFLQIVNLEIFQFSSSKSEICFGSRTRSFKARGLICWNQTLELCPKGVL